MRASSNGNASRRERIGMMREAKKIQAEFVDQVDPLLTKDQKKEWDAIREEMREKAKERRRAG